MIGTETGEVFFLRNTGAVGRPEFKSRERLLGPGDSNWFLAADREPGRGARAQVHAVDYNRDGKMDLLVGDWSVIEQVRAGLTPDELKEVAELRGKLAALDHEMGFTRSSTSYRYAAYTNAKGDVGRKISNTARKVDQLLPVSH